MIISPLALLTPTLVMSCLGMNLVHAETRTNTKGCVDPSEVSDCWDYFPDKIEPHFSENWNMTYHQTYKILYNKAEGESYLMYQCGTTPPESEVAKHDAVFSVPLQGGVAISQTTQINQLEQLGLRRQIKAYIGDTQYVSSPCLKTLVSENITDTVYNITAYLENNPDLVTLYGSSPFSTMPTHKNRIAISESSEGENRAIFEWHKVFGSLFNLEKEANDQFEASSGRFDCGTANAEYISTTVLEENEKPNVLWGYYSNYVWGGVTYTSWSVATCDPKYNYYCEYADKCYSNLLHANASMNKTEFMNFGKEADVWIYSGYNWNEMYEEFGEELASFKSVQNQAVYDVLGSGSGPWFEQRTAEYDVVQQDFCDAVGHTDEGSQPHNRVYLRKVLPMGVEDVGSLGDCDLNDIDVQWESRASECAYLDINAEIPQHPTGLGPNDLTAECADPSAHSHSTSASASASASNDGPPTSASDDAPPASDSDDEKSGSSRKNTGLAYYVMIAIGSYFSNLLNE